MAEKPISPVEMQSIAAQLAAKILGEAFKDMAVALSRYDARGARQLVTDIELRVVDSLKQFGALAGEGKRETVSVQVAAAQMVREITQEAKQRIIDADHGN